MTIKIPLLPLALVVALFPSAFPRELRQQRAVPCDAYIEDGTLKPSAGPEFDFDNFPCGTFPFDGSGPEERLTCTYYPRFESYECVSESNRAPDIVEAARNAGFENNQPCTAKGYKLDKVRTWWWECVKEA